MTQAQVKQVTRIKPENKALNIMFELNEGRIVSADDAQWLAQYVGRLQRAAQKSSNQRMALRQLGKAHNGVLQEVRYRREMMRNWPTELLNVVRMMVHRK